MSDIQFWTGGESLRVSEDGMVAVLESEFIEWTVSWSVLSDLPIFVRFGPEVLRLENHPRFPDRFRVPPKIRKKAGVIKEESRSKGYIGTVSLYKDEACTESLTPVLRVHSTNLTREEFVEILEDLRNQVYAVSIYSTHLQVMGTDNSNAGDMMPLAKFLRVLAALEPVIDVYRKQLKMIQRNPARKMIRVLKVMSMERAVSKGHVGQTFRVPEDRRKVLVVGRESTLKTPEQRFITSTSSQLLLEGRAVLSLLRSRLEELSLGETDAATGQKFYPLVYTVARAKYRAIQAKKGVQPKGVSHPVDVRTAREMIARISKKIDGLQVQIGNPQMDIEGTRVRTNRLEMSLEYAPVLRAWTDFSHQSTGFDRTSGLLNELDERTVAPSSILYERWVTVRIYSELLRRGFHPVIGQANLIDLMSVTDGEVVLQRGALDIALTGEFASKSVGVRIRHEPIMNRKDGGGYRTPDLVLDITVTKEEGTITSQIWVLDAKFKNYQVAAPFTQIEDEKSYGSHFFADLLGVAEHKYRRGLGVFGSAIVHPDVSPEFLYLDESKSNKWRKTHIESPFAHTVLALPLRPGPESDRQVSRIFKVIFGYHMHLDDICWVCGSEAEKHPVPGVTQGDGYSCPGCGSFWISHRCFECRHEPLLKFASDPIHRTEEGQPFNVHCPECGAYFQLNKRVVQTR